MAYEAMFATDCQSLLEKVLLKMEVSRARAAVFEYFFKSNHA
jgi:hypothetical protein